MKYRLNYVQYLLYFLFGLVPSRFGRQSTRGVWYDTYYNRNDGSRWAFEKSTGTFFERGSNV